MNGRASIFEPKLIDKVRVIFERRYGKNLSDTEVEEISNNLLAVMEVFVAK